MGETVPLAKHGFAPLNAHTDTNRVGWTSLAMVEVLAGECSIHHQHFLRPCRSETQEKFSVRRDDESAYADSSLLDKRSFDDVVARHADVFGDMEAARVEHRGEIFEHLRATADHGAIACGIQLRQADIVE